MKPNNVVTFYTVEKITDYLKVGRAVERYCKKNEIVGTFFSTFQGINTTLSGSEESLLGLVSLLDKKFKIKIKDPTWSSAEESPFKRFKVKCRKNLLPLEGDFDPVSSTGKHLNASSWNK